MPLLDKAETFRTLTEKSFHLALISNLTEGRKRTHHSMMYVFGREMADTCTMSLPKIYFMQKFHTNTSDQLFSL